MLHRYVGESISRHHGRRPGQYAAGWDGDPRSPPAAQRRTSWRWRDPYTAISLNNLAGFFKRQGKYEEAEPLYQRALRIEEQHLGPGHSEVAYPLNGLADIYQQQGRYAEAEPLYLRALAIREQQMGETHLQTAEVLDDFAGLQQVQGRTREAAALYQRALTTREHVLGPEHQLTLDTRARLQEVLVALGQTPENTPAEA